MPSEKYIWEDRKRTIFGLPLSFTRYKLTKNKLVLDIGFLKRSEDEIRLYRITDITLIRSLRERIWGLGTIHCCSGDKSSPEFNISHIKHSKKIKEMLSDMIEEERMLHKVGIREYMEGDHDGDEGEDDGIHNGGAGNCDCGCH